MVKACSETFRREKSAWKNNSSSTR